MPSANGPRHTVSSVSVIFARSKVGESHFAHHAGSAAGEGRAALTEKVLGSQMNAEASDMANPKRHLHLNVQATYPGHSAGWRTAEGRRFPGEDVFGI